MHGQPIQRARHAYRDRYLVGKRFVLNKTCDATHAVAALLGFAAIGVINTYAEVLVLTVAILSHQQLVETDAGTACGNPANLRGAQRNVLANAIDNDEVVP